MAGLIRQIIFLAAFCLPPVLLPAQKNATTLERPAAFTDSLIKSETAFFTIKGAASKKADSLAASKTTLTEIAVSNCSEKEVFLSWSTFSSSVSTFIHLYFKGEAPGRMMDSIFLVTHSHFIVDFPRAAFQGLYQPYSCIYTGGGKKSTFFSPYYKAFYSADKRRLYIYMIGGNGLSKYEVTWVVVNDKYYSRILDDIP